MFAYISMIIQIIISWYFNKVVTATKIIKKLWNLRKCKTRGES